jgi:biotin transport system substrate-specific component
MAKVIANPVHATTETHAGPLSFLKDAGIIISATVFLAACAHVSFPLLFSPVPLTLQNFGVLLIGLILGRNRAAAALVLYLLEGASGLPVFSPAGPGGVAQLLGPTGGFLLAYPVVAYMCGFIAEKLGRDVRSAIIACLSAEFLLFVSGAAYLRALMGGTLAQTLQSAVIPFLPGEVLKVAAAATISARWYRRAQK